MQYEEFLTRVIDDGIEAAKRDYAEGDSRREGAIIGFEACRGLDPVKLKALLADAQTASRDATYRHYNAGNDVSLADHWWHRAYVSEVEWVCNVVSALLVNEKLPPLIPPTARGVQKAADILGVGVR